MSTALHPLALEYLLQVEDALAPLPRGRRDDVLDDLHEHLEAALAGTSSEADVMNALDRLGDPREVAAAALAEEGIDATPRGTTREWIALALILWGVPTIVLWVVGVAMVWESPAWQPRHKVLATVMMPVAYLGSAMLPGAVAELTGVDSLALMLSLQLLPLAVPFAVTLMLVRALRRYREATAL